MKHNLFQQSEEIYHRYHEEIAQRNRTALNGLLMAGIPLSIFNFLAQSSISARLAFGPSMWLILYFCFIHIINKYYLKRNFIRISATQVLYLVEVPIMITVILMGTFLDPTHQALTFFIFLMAMPMFILDRPRRLLGIMAGWTVLFLFCSFVSKEWKVFRADVIHTAEFYTASVTVTVIVLLDRLNGVANYMKQYERTRRDVLTGLLNQEALEEDRASMLGRLLTLTVLEIEDLKLLNDMYGHSIGDQVLKKFADIVCRHITIPTIYRYGGNEILLVSERDPGDGRVLSNYIAEIEQELRATEISGLRVNINIYGGYTRDRAMSKERLIEMGRLAEIRAFRARYDGVRHLFGGPYSSEEVQAEMIEAVYRGDGLPTSEKDALTGLANRNYFLQRSGELLANVIDLSKKPIIVYINICNLRLYNQEKGYAAGDQLIIYIADLLQESFPGRIVARFSEDHFVAMLYEVEIGDRLERIIDQAFHFRDDWRVYLKMGIYLYEKGDEISVACDRAKLACDSIRDVHDVNIYWYDREQEQRIREQEYILGMLDEAISSGYIQAYYQPIVSIETRRVVDEEALSRWIDPVRGLLPPNKYIPVLEKHGLMYKHDLHMVRQVVRDMETRKEEGIPVVPVSLNFSISDFERQNMVEEIRKIIDDAGIPHRFFTMEITESAVAKDESLLKRVLKEFHANDFSVWMDDFGSGYSSLNVLQHFDFDLLKLDMRFTSTLANSERDQIVTKYIIQAAKQLQIRVLAEGVETEEQFEILKSLGCEKLQGYLFNKPNPLSYIMERYKTHTGLEFEKM